MVYKIILKQFTRLCIVYAVLNALDCLWTLNSMLYCGILHSKCIFFLHLNNLIARNQHCFWKTYTHFFSFTFDSMEPMQLLKTYEKNVYKCIGFLHENYQQQHALLYNLPTIHSIQRYKGLCELTTCSQLPRF